MNRSVHASQMARGREKIQDSQLFCPSCISLDMGIAKTYVSSYLYHYSVPHSLSFSFSALGTYRSTHTTT